MKTTVWHYDRTFDVVTYEELTEKEFLARIHTSELHAKEILASDSDIEHVLIGAKVYDKDGVNREYVLYEPVTVYTKEQEDRWEKVQNNRNCLIYAMHQSPTFKEEKT